MNPWWICHTNYKKINTILGENIMALVLLNPGLRPMGQFDLNDGQTVNGGEYAELTSEALTTEGYAADVGTAYGSGIVANSQGLNFALGARTAVPDAATAAVGGLTDEGSDNYGTLFGSAISMFGTGFGTQSTRGVVTLGPKTDLASGKATIWHQSGLYGVTTDAVTASTGTNPIGTATATNARLYALAAGTLSADASAGVRVAIYLGAQRDRSLVSTTAAAAGETATTDHYVIYFQGM